MNNIYLYNDSLLDNHIDVKSFLELKEIEQLNLLKLSIYKKLIELRSFKDEDKQFLNVKRKYVIYFHGAPKRITNKIIDNGEINSIKLKNNIDKDSTKDLSKIVKALRSMHNEIKQSSAREVSEEVRKFIRNLEADLRKFEKTETFISSNPSICYFVLPLIKEKYNKFQIDKKIVMAKAMILINAQKIGGNVMNEELYNQIGIDQPNNKLLLTDQKNQKSKKGNSKQITIHEQPNTPKTSWLYNTHLTMTKTFASRNPFITNDLKEEYNLKQTFMKTQNLSKKIKLISPFRRIDTDINPELMTISEINTENNKGNLLSKIGKKEEIKLLTNESGEIGKWDLDETPEHNEKQKAHKEKPKEKYKLNSGKKKSKELFFKTKNNSLKQNIYELTTRQNSPQISKNLKEFSVTISRNSLVK